MPAIDLDDVQLQARAATEIERALQVFKRHGYTSGDLDFLLYEGADAPGMDDPELDAALGVLGKLREAGFVVR